MLTTRQAAAELGVNPSRIRQMITEDLLPRARKLGRDWLIDPADLDRARKRRRPGRPKRLTNSNV